MTLNVLQYPFKPETLLQWKVENGQGMAQDNDQESKLKKKKDFEKEAFGYDLNVGGCV